MSYASAPWGNNGYLQLGSAIGTWATTKLVDLTTAGPTVVGFVDAGGASLTIDCISATVNVRTTVTAAVLTMYRIVSPPTALTTPTYSLGTLTVALARIIGDVVQFYPSSNNVLNPGELMSIVCTTAATAGSCFLTVQAHAEQVNPTAVGGPYTKPVTTGALGGVYVVSA